MMHPAILPKWPLYITFKIQKPCYILQMYIGTLTHIIIIKKDSLHFINGCKSVVGLPKSNWCEFIKFSF